MDVEQKILDIIGAKNETNKLLTELKARVDELEKRLASTLKVDNLQVGNFTFIGMGDKEGVWLKKDDKWYKVSIGDK